MIMFDMLVYCENRGYDFIVTSTVSTIAEDKKLGRVSRTHRESRAWDVSTIGAGWDGVFIKNFITHFSKKYADYAAINTKGEKRLIVNHNSGNGPHLHIQLHSRYATPAKLLK